MSNKKSNESEKCGFFKLQHFQQESRKLHRLINPNSLFDLSKKIMNLARIRFCARVNFLNFIDGVKKAMPQTVGTNLVDYQSIDDIFTKLLDEFTGEMDNLHCACYNTIINCYKGSDVGNSDKITETIISGASEEIRNILEKFIERSKKVVEQPEMANIEVIDSSISSYTQKN